MPENENKGIPDREECGRLLDDRRVPPHIRDHSRMVASLAVELGTALNRVAGTFLDTRLLEAAGLLHDIAKADCIDGQLLDHAARGGAFLRERGYPVVAAAVERHIYVTEEDCRPPLAEPQVLCYADKRVLHDQVVSLHERYDDLVLRYGTTPRLKNAIEANRALAVRLENIIFSALPMGPETLGV
jgi:putative nucleotidyltransferase with HDIG domain